MAKNETLEVVTVRLPPSLIKKLPRPSLKGNRAKFLREAIEEKIKRDEATRGAA